MASFTTLALVIAVSATGCGDGAAGGKTVLDTSNFDGRIMFHDEHYIEIENNSGHDLDDVKVSLKFYDGNGGIRPVEQHWARWNSGEIKKVVARDAEGKPVNNLTGAAGEGFSTNFSFRFSVSLGDEF
jgi:hypothetical protein